MSLLKKICSILALGFVISAGAGAASSISYKGITWTFSADRPTGTFANGEPWVVGPVTIVNIDPNPSQSPSHVQNGSMINPIPGGNFGFDSRPYFWSAKLPNAVYAADKNVALSFPFVLNSGDVLVSAKSRNVDPTYPTWLQTVCALTVLNTAPPAGSFRPGIFGTDRTVRWNTSQINWSVLKNYAAPASTPTKSAIESYIPALPWFEWHKAWNGNELQPRDNTADGGFEYGREIAAKFGHVALWLNTNQSQADKESIAIRMIQNGIDIYEYVKNGGGYYHDGGHKCGRKLPLVLAAMMLNDSALKTMAADPSIFQEDTQIWFVTQADVGRSIITSYPGYPTPQTYQQGDVGTPEWGIRHRSEPFQDNRNWLTGYRTTVGVAMMSSWLAAHLMGAQTTWNHPAAFAYMSRYHSIEGFNGPGGGISGSQTNFATAMWNTHKSGGIIAPPTATTANPVISPAGEYFDSPQSVSMSSVTPSSTVRYTLNGSEPTVSSPLYTGPISISASTTIKAIAYAPDIDPSGVSTVQLTFSASPPVFSPLPGAFSVSQSVTLSTSTVGSEIRYTTDGSAPTAASQLYSAPIPVSATTSIKAISLKSGIGTSPVSSGLFAIGELITSSSWTSVAISPSRTNEFIYSFNMTPSAANIDAVVGLGGISPVTGYADFACIVRFNPSGKIDVRNGSIYSSSVDYPYSPGVTYKVRMTVHLDSKTYDVKVSVNGGAEVVLANAASFRTEQASLAVFNRMGFIAITGAHIVSSYGVTSDRPTPVQGLRRVE